MSKLQTLCMSLLCVVVAMCRTFPPDQVSSAARARRLATNYRSSSICPPATSLTFLPCCGLFHVSVQGTWAQAAWWPTPWIGEHLQVVLSSCSTQSTQRCGQAPGSLWGRNPGEV